MKILFILLVLLAELASAQMLTRTQMHMGTLIGVTLNEEKQADFIEAFKTFEQLDALLSTYKEDSEISRLNRHKSIEASPETLEVVRRALEIRTMTDGTFDITIGSLSKNAYRFGSDDAAVPDKKLLQKHLEGVGGAIGITKNRIELAAQSTVDLGGIGKGFAVDKAKELLQKRGIQNGVIAASGDIVCLGPCLIEITNPFKPESVLATFRSKLSKLSVSTSGNYERFIRHKSINHLLDPQTGKPQQFFASVTLISKEDNTLLDALATAVSVMSVEKAKAFLNGRDDLAYVLILNDERRLVSSNLKQFTKEFRFNR